MPLNLPNKLILSKWIVDRISEYFIYMSKVFLIELNCIYMVPSCLRKVIFKDRTRNHCDRHFFITGLFSQPYPPLGNILSHERTLPSHLDMLGLANRSQYELEHLIQSIGGSTSCSSHINLYFWRQTWSLFIGANLSDTNTIQGVN